MPDLHTDATAAAATHVSDDARAPVGGSRMLRAFAHRNYRLFFAGQLTSLVGTFLAQVAVVWLVYDLSRDPLMLGLVGFCGQIPMFAVAPFAGVWVDRLDRRRLLVVTQVLSMLQSFGLGLLVLTGVATVPTVAILALCQGLINAFDMPARQAFLVEMVTDPRDLPNAIALNSTMVHGARLIGPAMAGFLLYYIGAGWCFVLDGVSYAGVIGSLLAMRNLPVRTMLPRTRSVLHELKEGLAYVWHFRPIRVLLVLMAVLSLTGMPAFMTLMPIFADHFGGGAERGSKYLGFLMAASGLGALAGAVYLASRRSVVGLGGVIGAAAGVFGAALVAFSFSRNLGVSLAVVALAGGAMMMNFASSNTLLQTLSDEDKRGRVMSLFTVAFIGVAPFGNLLAGALARSLGDAADGDHLRGASLTLRIEGAICLAAAVAFALMLPAMRRLVMPVYVSKGILPPVVTARGINSATEVVSSGERT